MRPVRFRCRTAGFQGLGWHGAEAATHGLGVCPRSLLPTHRQTVQGARPAPHPRVGEAATSANSQGRLLQQKAQSWHQTCSHRPRQPRMPGSDSPAQPGQGPSCRPLEELWAWLCFSGLPLHTRGLESQGKQNTLPLPQGPQNLPN